MRAQVLEHIGRQRALAVERPARASRRMKKQTVIVRSTIGIAVSTRLSAYPNIYEGPFRLLRSPATRGGERRGHAQRAAAPQSVGYSDLLNQRTRLMSLALSTKPEILGETTFLDTYQ